MKIASFDIFDTCLIRLGGSPDSIFYLMGKKLSAETSPALCKEFVCYRKKAEQMAWNIRGKNYSLSDIYTYFDFSSFPQHNKDEFVMMEENLEQEMLRAVYSTRELIKQKRQNGYAIVFISDMYLNDMLLQSVLIREGLFECQLPIFRSEYKRTINLVIIHYFQMIFYN